MTWFRFDARLELGYAVTNIPARSRPFVYSHEFASFAAHCARAAYKDREAGTAMFKEAGFNDVHFIERGATQAYAAIVACDDAPPTAVLTFRGTDSIQDLLIDAKFWRRRLPRPGLAVHRGFERALDDGWDDIVAVFSSFHRRYGASTIHLMGHSLGGALALLAAHRLTSHPALGTIASVVTVGCPRVGNANFAREIAKCAPIHRVVHSSDVVPRVPPLLFGYRHAGAEHWLLPDGQELTMPGDARPTVAQRVRWIQAVYEQSYAFRQYVLTSAIVALLATTATYKGLNVELSVTEALSVAVAYWILLMFLVADLVPSLPPRLQRWFRPHAVIDHDSDLYAKALAARNKPAPSPRPESG